MQGLLSSNIPLNTLSNNEFKCFLKKYTNEDIPREPSGTISSYKVIFKVKKLLTIKTF